MSYWSDAGRLFAAMVQVYGPQERYYRIRRKRERAFDIHRMEHSNRSFAWLAVWDKLYHFEELLYLSSSEQHK